MFKDGSATYLSQKLTGLSWLRMAGPCAPIPRRDHVSALPEARDGSPSRPPQADPGDYTTFPPWPADTLPNERRRRCV